ncbi:heavy metal translocating P-type ATPase [Sanguibacter keddieii]|uniref:heavy metal translocating P-type ATPase n=1 Tax=Sanguibacter keddieii TaxID=60920 RepID=UPI000324CF35
MSRECCGGDDTQPSPVASPRTLQGGESQVVDPGALAAPVPTSRWWRDRSILVPLGAGLLLALGYALEWSGAGAAAAVVLAASLLVGASTFVPGAVRRLARGRLGVGLLMTVAAVGAVLLGHVGEAAALAFLFSIAEALEDRAMDRAKAGLRSLLSLVPETATVSRLSGDEVVPVAEVRELDLLVVRAGERLATDGVVAQGRSSMDASAVTGESIPVEVAPGDAVAAGSINGSGTLLVEATASGTENSLTTIVRLVEQAHQRKGDRARVADRIARPLVPAVLVAAALVALGGAFTDDPGLWVERALVVLVAASPCALAIAVPVTVISAIGSASRFGVVITSGQAFERLGAVSVVAFDKTGTLTQNRPTVVEVATADGIDRDAVLEAAAALEARSTHPLASAVLAAHPAPPVVDDAHELAGQGLTGTVHGAAVRVGSPRWVDPGLLEERCARMEADGMTVVVVEVGGRPAGLLGIRDELRPEAAAAVAGLHAQGIETVMLTGDNPRTAAALARTVGIADVRAQQLPTDKAAAVDALGARGVTAMVGDGINDAPALATAGVGIAMGATGSAAAVESADVTFTGSDLRLIPQALAHARRGHVIMTQNIVLALLVVVVLVPLALTGTVALAGVVLVHELAEVLIIANGVRASRGRPALPGLPAADVPVPATALTR